MFWLIYIVTYPIVVHTIIYLVMKREYSRMHKFLPKDYPKVTFFNIWSLIWQTYKKSMKVNRIYKAFHNTEDQAERDRLLKELQE